ncbi:MAG: hypothetical protein IBX45_03380 [Campylobacterales bacterium]|nr:hypothetical protein [Campylobacterales bacterium]
MTLRQKVAALVLVAATSVFAGSSIEALVDEMNKTTDEAKKSELMQKIDQKLLDMNEADRAKAIEKINANRAPKQ